MSSYTLDDIRAAAEAKYGSTDIAVGETTVRLLNPLRLSKEKRAALTSMQEDNDNQDDADAQEKYLSDAIRLVAENEHQANVLLAAIGDDLALLAQIFETYTKSTELGEASASAA